MVLLLLLFVYGWEQGKIGERFCDFAGATRYAEEKIVAFILCLWLQSCNSAFASVVINKHINCSWVLPNTRIASERNKRKNHDKLWPRPTPMCQLPPDCRDKSIKYTHTAHTSQASQYASLAQESEAQWALSMSSCNIRVMWAAQIVNFALFNNNNRREAKK